MINVKDIKVKDLYKKDVPINRAYVGDDIVFNKSEYKYTFTPQIPSYHLSALSQIIYYKYTSYKQKIIDGIVQDEKILVNVELKHKTGEQFYSSEYDHANSRIKIIVDENTSQRYTRTNTFTVTQNESGLSATGTIRQTTAAVGTYFNFYVIDDKVGTTNCDFEYDSGLYKSWTNHLWKNKSINGYFRIRGTNDKYVNLTKTESVTVQVLAFNLSLGNEPDFKLALLSQEQLEDEYGKYTRVYFNFKFIGNRIGHEYNMPIYGQFKRNSGDSYANPTSSNLRLVINNEDDIVFKLAIYLEQAPKKS